MIPGAMHIWVFGWGLAPQILGQEGGKEILPLPSLLILYLSYQTYLNKLFFPCNSPPLRSVDSQVVK